MNAKDILYTSNRVYYSVAINALQVIRTETEIEMKTRTQMYVTPGTNEDEVYGRAMKKAFAEMPTGDGWTAHRVGVLPFEVHIDNDGNPYLLA